VRARAPTRSHAHARASRFLRDFSSDAALPPPPAASLTGHHNWNYGGTGTGAGSGGTGAGYALRRAAPPPIPAAPPAPPAPPCRLAALPPGPPPAALPLRPDRPGAAAGGGAAAASSWATVSADAHRRDAVRDAMRHAWSSYAENALGYDELQPSAKRGKNGFGGMGATIVDALDTLHIMGLDAEFTVARNWVADSLTFNRFFDASVFETTIRIVGGLLSAHHLTGDALFVDKAKELADRLMPAFETPTGIPFSTVNLKSGKTRNAVRGAGRGCCAWCFVCSRLTRHVGACAQVWTQSASPLAEFGTTQARADAHGRMHALA
jgi:hypothetical protein